MPVPYRGNARKAVPVPRRDQQRMRRPVFGRSVNIAGPLKADPPANHKDYGPGRTPDGRIDPVETERTAPPMETPPPEWPKR